MTKRSQRCMVVRARLKVKNTYKIRQEVHSSATAGAGQLQNEVGGPWQCQSKVKALRIVTRLGKSCRAVPMQVQGNDKMKFEVHGSVRVCLMFKNS